jgi:hypothetical protein
LTELNENPKKGVAKTICAVFGAVTETGAIKVTSYYFVEL